jgi:hypothetical protein
MVTCPECQKVMEHVNSKGRGNYAVQEFECKPCQMQGFVETTFQRKCTCGAPNGARHSKDCNAEKL